jgi:hypothetical protein
MVFGDLVNGLGQGLPEDAGDPFQRVVPIRRVELPGGWREVHPVEPEGVLPHGGVTPGQHVLENIGDAPAGIRIGPGLPGE